MLCRVITACAVLCHQRGSTVVVKSAVCQVRLGKSQSIRIWTGSTETLNSIAQNPQAEVKQMSCRAVEVLQAPKPLWGAAVLVGVGFVCYQLRRLLDTYRPSLQQHMYGETPNCFATHPCRI